MFEPIFGMNTATNLWVFLEMFVHHTGFNKPPHAPSHAHAFDSLACQVKMSDSLKFGLKFETKTLQLKILPETIPKMFVVF